MGRTVKLMRNFIIIALVPQCLVLSQQGQPQSNQHGANHTPPRTQQGQNAEPHAPLQQGQPQMREQPQMGQPQMGQPHNMGQPQMGQAHVGQPQMGDPRQGHPQGVHPQGQQQFGLPVSGLPQREGQPQMAPQSQPVINHDAAYNPDAAVDDGGRWLDSAPGVAMEYKVHVDAGMEDCYWQYVHKGATFFVSSQVLKGGDGNIGVGIRQPSGKVVYPYQWKASAEYEEDGALGGYYSVCLDNQFSKFSAKLVNLYITTFRYDEWERLSEELQDLDMSVGNFTETLTNVDKRVQVIRQFQQLSRGLESRDYNLLVGNLNYVTNWSLVQCVIIILCGLVQVHFVRNLFGSNTRGKSQLRA